MAVWIAYAALAGYQLISGAQQAEATREHAKLTKDINDLNADYVEQDAFQAEADGATEEARYQSQIDEVIGDQKVALASQNVDINFGTAKELQTETRITGFLNQLDIRNQAAAKARGLKTQARNIRLQGSQIEAQGNMNANAIQSASMLNAASSSISGYSNYQDRLDKLKTPKTGAG